MTDQTVKAAASRYACRYSWLAEAVRDALMVSSFGLWALLLGFAPVVAFMLWEAELRQPPPWLIGGSVCLQMRAKLQPAF
jgi:hypothetical protein